MVVFSILGFLFKKRMTFAEIFGESSSENGGEFILKLLKFACWYLFISTAYYSIQQPIGSNQFGVDLDWPFDSAWFCIDKMCDLVRTALQYRMSIKWQ